MALVLNEEQTLLRDSAGSRITDKAPIAHFRKLRDDKDARGYSPEMWKTFAEMGFCGLLVPEEFGGSGLGHVEAASLPGDRPLCCRRRSFRPRADRVCDRTLRQQGAEVGAPAEDCRWLALGALAIDEAAKHRPQTIKLKAERSGNGFPPQRRQGLCSRRPRRRRDRGCRRTSGADSDRNGITLFLVNPRTNGVAVERTIMVDAYNSARVEFSNVELTADNVLGESRQGPRRARRRAECRSRSGASEMLGSPTRHSAAPRSILMERKQFGKLIGEFQALQHASRTSMSTSR